MRRDRSTRPTRVTFVALAVTVCAACSQGGAEPGQPAASASVTSAVATSKPATTASSSSPTAAPTPAAPATTPVPAALDFRATTVDGAAFSGADLAGRKTVLWFWAPWCTVCARAAPDVTRAAASLGPDVRVVGVAGLSADATDMRRFVERGSLQSLTHLADTSGDIYARFGVTQQDTFVLVRPDGTVSRHPAYSQDVDLVALARQTFG